MIETWASMAECKTNMKTAMHSYLRKTLYSQHMFFHNDIRKSDHYALWILLAIIDTIVQKYNKGWYGNKRVGKYKFLSSALNAGILWHGES